MTPYKIAITGNIATGKSLVGDYLISQNYKVIDSDKLVHDILSTPNAITEQLIDLCGDSICDNLYNSGNGNTVSFVKRSNLAKIFFADLDTKQQCEQIIHKEVRYQTQLLLQYYKDSRYIFNLIPQLFESQIQSQYDYICLIYCDPIIQRQRLQQRHTDWSQDTINLRLNAQMPQDHKKAQSDYIIDNSRAVENTYEQINQLLKDISQKVNNIL